MKERIETVVDRLLEYVALNGDASVKKTASALGLQSTQVERLALLLEQNGLMEVRYDLLGATLHTKSKPEEKQKPAGDTSRAEKARQLEEEILKTENLMAFFEKDLERRIIQAESILEELEKKTGTTPEELDAIRKEVDAALGQLAAFSDQIRELSEKEQAFYEKLVAFKKKILQIQTHGRLPTTPLLERLRHWIETILSRFKPPRKPDLTAPATPPITFEPTLPTATLSAIKNKHRRRARRRDR